MVDFKPYRDPLSPAWLDVADLLDVPRAHLIAYDRDPLAYAAAHPHLFTFWWGDPTTLSAWDFIVLWLAGQGNALTIHRKVQVSYVLSVLENVPAVKAARIAMTNATGLLPNGLAALERAEELLASHGLTFLETQSGDEFSYAVISTDLRSRLQALLTPLGMPLATSAFDVGLFASCWPELAHDAD